MSSLTPGQSQNPYYAAFALDLASNENLLMVLQTGTAAQERRRRPSASTPPQDHLPSSIGLRKDLKMSPPTPAAVSDGYESSDDSLHLPPSARHRRARANAPFLPPLPGHSAVRVADVAACVGTPHGIFAALAAPAAAAAAAAATSASARQVRRNSGSSISSAFSWQESIFHVRRLSDACDAPQLHAPTPAPRGEHGVRSLMPPPPRHGSRPHPNPLHSTPVFEGGWI